MAFTVQWVKLMENEDMGIPKINHSGRDCVIIKPEASSAKGSIAEKNGPTDLFENNHIVGRVPKASLLKDPLVEAVSLTLVTQGGDLSSVNRLLRDPRITERINDPDFTAMDAALFLWLRDKANPKYADLVQLLKQHGAKPKAMVDDARRWRDQIRVESDRTAGLLDFEG